MTSGHLIRLAEDMSIRHGEFSSAMFAQEAGISRDSARIYLRLAKRRGHVFVIRQERMHSGAPRKWYRSVWKSLVPLQRVRDLQGRS